MKENNVYIIDEHFCEFAQKEIAKIMGMVAKIGGNDKKAVAALQRLSNMMKWFDGKELKNLSDRLNGLVNSTESVVELVEKC